MVIPDRYARQGCHRFTVLAVLCALLAGPVEADNYFDRYGLTPASTPTDIGVQPLGIPSGVISSVMARDRILRQALENGGQTLKTHPFWRGPDMIDLLADQRLEGGLLGDMPTIHATATGKAVIVGLVKQTSTSIVGKGITQVSDLAGKRIGYVAASSAHHTLLQGLASAGLDEQQVKLVALAVSDMPDALERGDIDAFSAWEPYPSIALTGNKANRIVFRGLTTDYLVFNRSFVERRPEAALHVVAGFVRAIEWMRRSRQNLSKAVQWAAADGTMLSGKPPALGLEQAMRITRQDILEIPSAPAIPGAATGAPLKAAFEFLRQQDKLPKDAHWRHIESAFKYDGLTRVLAEPERFRTHRFDYAD